MMMPSDFEHTLRAFASTRPFQPFVVELTSGTQIKIDHPVAVVVRGGLAVYVSPEGLPSIFQADGVSQVTMSGARGAS